MYLVMVQTSKARSKDLVERFVNSPRFNGLLALQPIADSLAALEGVDLSCAVEYQWDGTAITSRGTPSTVGGDTSICPDDTELLARLVGTSASAGVAMGLRVEGIPGAESELHFVKPTSKPATGAGEGEDAPPPPECFPADTLVLVGNAAGIFSYRRIDSLSTGDTVLSLPDTNREAAILADPRTPDRSIRPALRRYMSDLKPVTIRLQIVHQPAVGAVVRVQFSDGELITTASHPVFAIGLGWTQFGRLKSGDLLLNANGGSSRINSFFAEPPPAALYNLALDSDFTFFVLPKGARYPILVHNNVTGKTNPGL